MVGPTEAVKEAMMGIVVSINRSKSPRFEVPGSKARIIVEETLFVLGVMGTFVALPIIYCINGGPVPLFCFVISAQAGVIAGLVKYIQPAASVLSVVDKQTTPVSRNDQTNRRKVL
jgi:hypothetical protein